MGALFDIYGNPIRTISPPVNPDKSVLLAVTLVDQEGNPVTPGGGGGGGTYTNATPMPAPLGGLAAGSTFSGWTMTQMFDSLLYPYQAPAFTSFSITAQPTTVEVGTTVSGLKNFSWVTSNGANVQPNTILIRDVTNSAILVSGLANDGAESVNVGGITKLLPGAHSWRAEGQNSKLAWFTSGNFTVNWFWRRFVGTSLSTTVTEAEIEALVGNTLASGFAGTYPMAAGGYKFFCWPVSFGSPAATTGFRDQATNLSVDMATASDDPFFANTQNGWSYGLVSVTNINGVNTQYRVYRSKNILGGAVTVVIS